MSMNLHLLAKLDADTKLGKKEIIERFSLIQTSTEVTRKILGAPDQFKAYSEWILAISTDKVENVYADNDFFREREPIGTEIVNYGKDHLGEVEQWLKEHEGWEIEWYEL